jgi:hypothetical protein
MTPSKTAVKTRTSALLGSETGQTFVLKEKEPTQKSGDQGASGGVIYTDEMPKLGELLERYKIVSAVLSESVAEPPVRTGQTERRPATGFGRAIILGGFPSAMFVAGVVMAVGALAGGSTVSNPYLALFLLIAGFGLGLTSWAALREARRR